MLASTTAGGSSECPPKDGAQSPPIAEDSDRTIENASLLHTSPRRHTHPHVSFEEPTTPPYLIFLCVLVPAAVGLLYYSYYSRTQAAGKHTTKENLIDLVPATVLISIDGFRYDYLNRTKRGRHGDVPIAPTLLKLASNGVLANMGMQPVMPTKTFPNHWSLVTGLYPESHGIVGNTMYSPFTKKWFHYSGTDPHWWAGEPIWQTLQKTPRKVQQQGGKQQPSSSGNYTTGSVFWVGSEVLKHAPDAFWKYDKTVSYARRVDRTVRLLAGTATDLSRPAQFVTLYFDRVDSAGHAHGPDSKEVNLEIEKADSAIAQLLKKLQSAIGDRFNIIVLSDHGMTGVSSNRSVDFAPFIPGGTVQDIGTTPMGMWMNVTVKANEVAKEIRDGLQQTGNTKLVDVYRKTEIPERWHISRSPFIPEVVTLANLGWTVSYPHQNIVPDANTAPSRSITEQQNKTVAYSGGNHGFDNLEDEMQALFIASGPAFRSGATVKGFRNIDLYPLLCHLFSANPAPNNGSLDISLKSILRT